MRILHVTESYVGAGVSRAIESIAEALPDYEHHLVWAGKPSLVEGSAHLYKSECRLRDGLYSRIIDTRRAVLNVRPDVIHAHSSWAGLYTRSLPLGAPVVYEPHCYKFDDPTTSPVVRYGVHAVESILARRTDQTVALSPHEADLARGLCSHARVTVVPNVPRVRPRATYPSESREFGHANLRVVMVGRLCHQKDPHYFARLAETIHETDSDIQFVWVGDGEMKYRLLLEASGVLVTGWLSDDHYAELLASATLYFHSARYEGFPLSVLEAAAFKIPIIVRSISTFEGSGLLATSDSDAASTIIRTIRSNERLEAAVRRSTRLLLEMNPQRHRQKLIDVYQSASESNI